MIWIGNDAVEIEFSKESSALIPVRVTNKLAGREVSLVDSLSLAERLLTYSKP